MSQMRITAKACDNFGEVIRAALDMTPKNATGHCVQDHHRVTEHNTGRR
jgi:hypothetical protein